MASIFPDPANGGVTVRDGDGNCLAPPNVANAYCPSATFITTCNVTALPSDCTARLSAAQINAIASELLALAECFNPTGTWNCATNNNLCAMFNAWMASNLVFDPSVFDGDGTSGTPYTLIPVGISSLICGDSDAVNGLAGCLISGDAGNGLGQGSDGGLFSTSVVVMQPTAPATLLGRMWTNTSAATVSGVSAQATAIWNGTIWKPITFGSVTVGYNTLALTNGVAAVMQRGGGQTVVGGPDELVTPISGGSGIILEAGTYVVSAQCRFLIQITGDGSTSQSYNAVASILMNGVQIGTATAQQNETFPGAAGNANSKTATIAPHVVVVPAGAVIELQASFSASVPANVTSATVTSAGTHLTAQRIN